MRVAELIEILKLADADAEVFSEFEGSFGPVTADDVRTGAVTLLDVGSNYTNGEPMPATWMRDTHPCVIEGIRDGKIVSPWYGERPRLATALRRCQGVLLWSGQSDDEWPDRLDGKPVEKRA